MKLALPSRIDLDGEMLLRFLDEADAEAVAVAVRESLEHLRPWMPWADEQSTDPAFQRGRIRKLPGMAERGEEWQYGLFPADDLVPGKSRLLGSFGLMTRRGPGTLEIGYWVHVAATGEGRATRAAAALTDLALGCDGIEKVLICCDEANTRSAAIPQRLGYSLARVEKRRPEAPGERGRLQVWSRTRGTQDVPE